MFYCAFTSIGEVSFFICVKTAFALIFKGFQMLSGAFRHKKTAPDKSEAVSNPFG